MKKKLFLHIGTFKTGTSAIQAFLCKNRRGLMRQGFFVPRCGLVGHHELPLSLIQEHTKWRASWPSFTGSRSELWGRALKDMEESHVPNLIISSEAFCDLANENVDESSQRRMGKYVQDSFNDFDVTVIVYLRRLDLYAKSMYGENVRNSPQTASLREASRSIAKSGSIHLQPSRYLDFFAGLFGKDSVTVRLYDRYSLVEGDVVRDFASLLGIDSKGVTFAGKEDIHRSLDEDLIFLKRLFNLAGNQGFHFNQEIAKLLLDVNRVCTSSSNEGLDASVLKAMRDEGRYVQDCYGIDLSPPGAEARGGAWRMADEEVARERSAGQEVSAVDGLLIALLGMSLRQNRGILNRLERMERDLEQLRSSR